MYIVTYYIIIYIEGENLATTHYGYCIGSTYIKFTA